jgi:hypothetical protein
MLTQLSSKRCANTAGSATTPGMRSLPKSWLDCGSARRVRAARAGTRCRRRRCPCWPARGRACRASARGCAGFSSKATTRCSRRPPSRRSRWRLQRHLQAGHASRRLLATCSAASPSSPSCRRGRRPGQHDVFRLGLAQHVQVLVHGVGGAAVPELAQLLLRRHDVDVLAQAGLQEAPARSMWRIRLCALYCVSTPMRRMPELTQLLSAKSMMRRCRRRARPAWRGGRSAAAGGCRGRRPARRCRCCGSAVLNPPAPDTRRARSSPAR